MRLLHTAASRAIYYAPGKVPTVQAAARAVMPLVQADAAAVPAVQ